MYLGLCADKDVRVPTCLSVCLRALVHVGARGGSNSFLMSSHTSIALAIFTSLLHS